jgi:hypothetical protein
MATATRRKSSKAQSAEVNYELHSLGWKAFQNLCVHIASELWGQTVQSFFDANDGGRDGAFSGTWRPSAQETLVGSFTAQCKFTAKADELIPLVDMKDEFAKATALAARGLADHYILFTNARLTGATEADLGSAFMNIRGIQSFRGYGAERISAMIHGSARLRMLVPRVYVLGDLSQI